ncbi:hypothetical protein DL98DRAFT_533122 [Cadophora sp. DSE1049]|nr:hypothetical protein DL98DRAFT_533122 [Cadophora sp. DSE1049]
MAPPCCKEATLVDYTAPWSSTWQSVMAHYFLKHPYRPGLIASVSQELHQKLPIVQLGYNDWPEATEPCSNDGIQFVSIQGFLPHDRFTEIMPLKSDPSVRVPTQFSSHETDNIHRLRCLLAQVRYLRHKMPPESTEQVSGDVRNSIDGSISERLSTDYLCNVLGWTVNEAEIVGDTCDVRYSENGIGYVIPKGCQVGDRLCTFESSDVIAVVRSDPTSKEAKYSLVGRSIAIDSLITGRGTMTLEDSFGPPVDFIVDIPTLHLLTCGPPLDGSMGRIIDERS